MSSLENSDIKFFKSWTGLRMHCLKYIMRLSVSNIYSPRRCRGFVSLASGTSASAGGVAASIIAMPLLLGTDESWWYLYLIELVLLLSVAIMLPFLHESPK